MTFLRGRAPGYSLIFALHPPDAPRQTKFVRCGGVPRPSDS